jgi:alkylation response protein AidB-like acyl-CoA dehydrogenase
MDFSFSAEQEMLRQSARTLLEKECPTTVVRRLMDDAAGYSPQLWATMAELGWLGLTIPEQYGGSEASYVDLIVLTEEMGRAVLPSPYLWTVLFAEAIIRGGSDHHKQALLPAIAKGELIGTLALLDSPSWDLEQIAMPARAQNGNFILEGRKLYVNDAHIADYLLVPARTAASGRAGITLFAIERGRAGVGVQPLQTMDRTRKLAVVSFDKVQAAASDIVGTLDNGADLLEQVVQCGKVALAAEMVGGAQKVLDRTIDYARVREQFGRPIGSFQAVQHKCANMLIAIERARSVTYYGACALSSQAPDAAIAAATAKAAASDGYRDVAGDGIQLHGGIGFTWEHDMHLYFKRAKSAEYTFGDASFNREIIARHLAA